MNYVLQGPVENLPDVKVTSTVFAFRVGPDDGHPLNYENRVKYEAHCRFGCGSLFTPDVVEVVNYVNEHVISEGHLLAKQERLSNLD